MPRYRREGLHVVERIKQTRLLGSLVNLVRGVLHPLSYGIIILRASPLDNLGVAEVHLGRVQTQGVSAALGRRLHPEVADGLPVELDGGEVGGGDLGVELGQFSEEGAVDDADAVKEFPVVGSGYGAGDEDISDLLACCQGDSAAGGEGKKYLMSGMTMAAVSVANSFRVLKPRVLLTDGISVNGLKMSG